MQAVAVTDDAGAVLSAGWLARAEAVHRQLRPALPDDYCARMTAIFANGGRMAVVVDGEAVLAVSIWRMIENTSEGRRLYVDDLVSDDAHRSQGVGKCLLGWLEQKAVSLGCDALALDSGVQRAGAHRFYFREGMHIPAFCFRKALK
ncbi:GNAT family N-acetyltransferase [uncultured Propionivibrio sp.]|uniref:GNAT family N-acetyltransferase n=1 Tax=uncultured Propionivibrio sp. TaxID=426737 RepID=UPI0029C02AA8|nr:GNAT family N-acetyltransferase [uncultured Propionivibrio sp.]